MIYAILVGLFVIVAFLLVFIILIQSGKGGGLAGIAGGGMNQLFGGQGSAPFLTRTTAILATAFMVIALILGMITRGNIDQTSIMQKERERRMASPARTLPEVTPTDNAGSLPTE
ncbi:preprotein translocase subunit SecG [candidate division KSB1 bacterium]|nr:preprotein translocase subunit SecG [candidate division KSB1 bacterium]RQW00561.1 MAG: preprotein translocase subunit SecG [candidate division KSB1 bacterium]